MISVTRNDRESDVSVKFPLFEIDSPEEIEVSGETLDKTRIDDPNGVSGGRFNGTVGIPTTTMTGVTSELVNEELESKVETRVSDNMQSSDRNNVFDVVSEKTSSEEARVSSEVDSREIDRKMESSVVSEIKAEEVGRNDCYAVGETAEAGAKISSGETKGDIEMLYKPTVLDFNLAYSMVDEGNSARMFEALGSEAEKAMSYGFEPGDMVWGKVKSHPWWPGQIFNEAFASSSVRRSKREGHVLVAFFGDSSYGWFDPAELIPFEPHYSDKSQQTNSRTFMRAVEEAVDEARRRAAVGLVCCCRNPYNFRPTNVRGYFTVDVSDGYEGGVYSVKEIKKARDNFQPDEALSFVQQLAMKPRNNEQRGIDWIKNVSMFLALRKATYEEFDETYAQAFGVQVVQPVRDAMGVLDQAAKVPSRAPLSGPLVIAEALGERKSFTKSSKVKDQKDKYLLKRRDKLNDPKAQHFSQSHAGFVASSANKDGETGTAPGGYVLQKRTPAVLMKPLVPIEPEGIRTISWIDGALASGETQPKAEMASRKMDCAYSTSKLQGGSEHGKLPGDKDMNVLHEMSGRVMPVGVVGPTSTDLDGSIVLGKLEAAGIRDGFNQNLQLENKAFADLKQEESAKQSSISKGLEQSKLRLSGLEDHRGSGQLWECGDGRSTVEPVGTPAFPVAAKPADGVLGMSSDRVVKKAKVLKRPENLNSDKSFMGEKKKKKKKKLGLESSADQPHKPLRSEKDGESLRKSAGRSIGIGLVRGESSQLDPQRNNDGASSTFLSDSVELLPKVELANIKVELPQLVDDLLALALDPFHGVERNSPAIVRHVLLQFRSIVYQKSLVLVPVSEAETSSLSDSKSPAGAGPSKIPSGENAVNPRPKLPKPHARSDDPTKSGRKRSLSECQEEKSAKKLKKLNELKSLTAEKKVGTQKTPEPKQGERKEAGTGATVSLKPTKPDTVNRKPEPSLARVADPTMLVMKFPPRTTLPSIPELKARFARFGPLDHSALRVFWKSSTCRVVFKQRSHAVAAYNYAVRNNALFGHVKVNYQVKDVVVPAPEVPPESAKRRPDDTFDEVTPTRQTGLTQQNHLQPAVQLKSCLKKPSGEEMTGSAAMGGGGGGGVSRENNPRVKFKLGGDESSSIRGEEMMVSSSINNSNKNNNNGSSASSSSSSAHAMDVISKNFQKFIPPLQPTLLPLQPPRNLDVYVHDSWGTTGHNLTKSPHMNYNQLEEQRNTNNYIGTTISTSNSTTTVTTTPNKVDISSQMLSLMLRCSDIVRDVNSSLGYVPYHPL